MKEYNISIQVDFTMENDLDIVSDDVLPAFLTALVPDDAGEVKILDYSVSVGG